jgi:hypothetical protein
MPRTSPEFRVCPVLWNASSIASSDSSSDSASDSPTTTRLRLLTSAKKPEILKAYLDTFRREVHRYFPVPAGSPLEAFARLTESYPAFELQPG